MKKILLAMILFAHFSFAQVPLTVNRSTVDTGGTVSLPSFSATGSGQANTTFGANATVTFSIAQLTVTNSPGFMTLATGTSSNGTPSTTTAFNDFPGGHSIYGVTGTYTAYCILATNCPSVFTNTIKSMFFWSAPNVNVPVTFHQDYIFTIADDTGGGGGGGNTPTITITGQADTLESISRKNTTSPLRKLVGVNLTANTNSTLTSIAFSVSNTSTNGNNFSSLVLLRDADGTGTFDLTDTQIGSSSNVNGVVIFAGLNQSITSTNKVLFLAGSFDPSQQSQNSFISASLSSLNITATVVGTGTNCVISGGTLLGKQYAFLDTTTAEDASAAAALAAQINASISSATGSLRSSATSNSTDLIDSILPAAAAGVAGVGAAFTSDSIKQTPLSQEYLPSR
jgi:hypothetical protein